MKHRQCKSSIRELHRADMYSPRALQAAHQWQSPAVLEHREKHQRHSVVMKIRACWWQIGRCRASVLTAIPVTRPQTRNRRASVFFYSLARTTLLGSLPRGPATSCNCFTIGSSKRASAVLKAGLSRQFEAYNRHRAARRPTCCPRLRVPARAHRGDAPTSPAGQLLRFPELKA
jgi:hypothetical protein